MSGYPCPNCYALCRTVDTLSIHMKRCRAMSVSEFEVLLRAETLPFHDHVGGAFEAILEEDIPALARTIHAAHISKLRGRK